MSSSMPAGYESLIACASESTGDLAPFNTNTHFHSATADPALLSARGVTKSYQKGRLSIPVLKGVNLDIGPGEFVSIIGQSGSGKSTLLHLLGLLDAPDEGEIHFGSGRIDNVSASRRDRFRNKKVGLIFQFYHLLPELTTRENVLAPLMISHGFVKYLRHRRRNRERACQLLDMVGLSHRLNHRPHELSGGEMQRTAVARALMTRPQLLLADEPTGNLDSENSQEILQILKRLNRDEELTIVMVTHDQEIAREAGRTVCLRAGLVDEVVHGVV